MFKNWTNRDWFWLLGVLIGIIVLLVATIFARSKNIEVNFGIISSAVSIALALLAIFIAWKQDSDNQIVTRETSNLLTKITSKIDNMDSKLDKLDPNAVTAPAETQLLNDISEIIKNKKEDEQMISEINHTIKRNFNDINNKLKLYYDKDAEVKRQKMHNYKLLFKVPPESEQFLSNFIVKFMSLYNIENASHEFDGEVLKITFYRDSLIRIELLMELLEEYKLNLIDVGMNM